MLCYGNVHAGGKFLAVESCQGLLVGAMLERMGGKGQLVYLHPGPDPVLVAVDAYNFTEESLGVLRKLPLKEVSSLDHCQNLMNHHNVPSDEGPPPKKNKFSSEENKDGQNSECFDDDSATTVDEESTHSSGKDDIGIKLQQREEKRKQKEDILKSIKQELNQGNFDGLLMVCKYHPSPIVMALLDLVAPSRPLVVFSPFKEPLLDCYQRVRDRGGIVNLRLTETWFREYQVLPNRTHPSINMSNYSGYLLTGTTTNLEDELLQS